MNGQRRYLFFTLLFLISLSFSLPANSASEMNSTDAEYNEQLDLAVEDIQPYMGPRIEVNAAARKLRLYNQDELVREYSIAVGSPRHPTPIGPREMTQIVWNPWWIPPKTSAWAKNAKDTPPGPHNPLGRVKMRLGSAIMFHGTNKPHTVGKAASHGCMRMYTQEAMELARYIQEHMTDKKDPAIYEEYDRRSRRSFHVNLEQTVPVDIVYDLVEVKDGILNVYQDVYWRVRDKIGAVKTALLEKGLDPEKYDLAYIEQNIKQARNRKDLSFFLSEIALDHREKEVKTAQSDYAPASVGN